MPGDEDDEDACETPRPGMIVEDETVAGGRDAQGATVVAPKTTAGKVAEDIKPTDKREAPRKR
jgi:hypothetical protein